MLKLKIMLLMFLFTIVNANKGFSQTKFTISINKALDPNKIKIFFTDGPINKFISLKFIDTIAVLEEKINSKYARVIILYPNLSKNLQGTSFFINQKSGFLKFYKVEDSVSNKLSNYKYKNAIEISSLKENVEMNSYCINESKINDKLTKMYNNEISKSDSILTLLNKSNERLALKQLDYIKSHGNNYFLFWNFSQNITPILKKNNLLDLYEIFNTIFPEKFKTSYEGKYIRTLLEGNLYIKIGMQCPQFKTTDYLGNEISSEKLKGKYYLLSFWATWCGPCIKEIPQLKSIRASYKDDNLSIISITRDTDSAKFIMGIDKYKMNWIHLFNSPSMENLFGEKPIPSLYLIDKNGKIIFSSWEKNLNELDGILKSELN